LETLIEEHDLGFTEEEIEEIEEVAERSNAC